MAWTQTDLDALKAAMKRGERVVQYRDRRVEYRSMDEMIQLKNLMENEVNAVGNATPRHSLASFSKG